ncbi:MAG: beta-lactamase family protein [Candidatus Thermoplasmatota archaeon]|nr:beta-lactamase family protein [Candidatus Thermoplasmatota archaeon]
MYSTTHKYKGVAMMEIPEKLSLMIEEYLNKWMKLNGTPGLSLAITDSDRMIASYCIGEADISSHRPVSPHTLFQIGSVSKSFTCIALLQLAEKGVIDLNKKIVSYLPWFETKSGHEDITIHHMMTHTSGLIIGSDALPTAESEVWSLRSTDATSPKGSHFHYSNSAYKTLGILLETITGESYENIMRDRILKPLGMDSTEPVIRNNIKERSAVGYSPLYDDRPFIAGAALSPSTWFESNTADGSISSTGADMCAYMRMLLNQGRHPEGRILAEEVFEKMVSPYVDTNDGVHGRSYGYGLNIEEIDGNPGLGHQGGMVGFYTSMLMDSVKGIGVIVMINGPGEPYDVAKSVLRIVGSNGSGTPPVPKDPALISDPMDWVGRYVSRTETIEFLSRDGRVYLSCEGKEHQAIEIDRGAIYVNAPTKELCAFGLKKRDGRIVGVTHDHSMYQKEGEEIPSNILIPDEWKAYSGHYRSHNPWLNNFRIVLRDSGLVMIYPMGQEEPLTWRDDGSFRIGADPMSPERISFDAIIDGRALIAHISGGGMYGRTFTA